MLPVKYKLIYPNHIYKGSEIVDMLNEAHANARVEGWNNASRHFLKLYAEHFQTVQAWFHEVNRQIGRLEGILEYGVGDQQRNGITQLSDEIAKLLNQADIINQTWGLNNPGVLLDTTEVIELSSRTREYLSKQRTVQDIIDILPKVHKSLNSAKEMLKNELSVKNEVATRLANRVNDIRPEGSKNPTWREVVMILREEWRDKIADSQCDEIDTGVYKELQGEPDIVKKYVKTCWENRYSRKK